MDPACGSGNFLVIAYRELRRLEHVILQWQSELSSNDALFNESRINIENFYGIEIDDFAIEVATLSVRIAKHQMNREFQEQFGISIPRKWAQGFHQDAMARVADPAAHQLTGKRLILKACPLQ